MGKEYWERPLAVSFQGWAEVAEAEAETQEVAVAPLGHQADLEVAGRRQEPR